MCPVNRDKLYVMLYYYVTPENFATNNNGHVCKDKDYRKMQTEKKSKKLYLPDSSMATTSVSPRRLSVFGLNPGHTRQRNLWSFGNIPKLLIVSTTSLTTVAPFPFDAKVEVAVLFREI